MVYTICTLSVGLEFSFLIIFKDSRASITTMPTIFERWKTGKLLVWNALWRLNIYIFVSGGG